MSSEPEEPPADGEAPDTPNGQAARPDPVAAPSDGGLPAPANGAGGDAERTSRPGTAPGPPLPQSQPPLARQEVGSATPPPSAAAAPARARGRHDVGEPGWSAWQGVLGFVAALLGTVVLGGVLVGGIALALGTPLGKNSPALNIGGVVVQDLVFVSVAIAFAAITARPRAWHFGLRRTRLWPTVGWAALGIFLYLVFNIIYEAIVKPSGKQSVADALGVNDSAALLVLGGFVIIVMAPIAEEFFFRAFLYRTLRNSIGRLVGLRAGIVLGALLTGAIFGLVHFEPRALALLPILAVLGFTFCLVYERTGSLFSTIALHASVNGLAYLTVAKNSTPVALGFWFGMLAACVIVPRFLSRGPAPARA